MSTATAINNFTNVTNKSYDETFTKSKIPEFVQLQAEAFQSFNIDNSEKSLDKGVWYPTEYFDALRADQHQKNGQRIEWIKEKNICRQGYVDNKSFEPIEDHIFTFAVKTNVVASEALRRLTEGLTLLECGTVLQLSQWIALRDYIGPKNFDTLLSLPKNTFSPLYLQHGAYILSQLYQEVKIQGEKEIFPGDICYFKNISKYHQKNPFGPALGWNTVCVQANGYSGKEDGAKFMGFGLSVDGNSSSEIESQLFKEYNEEPLDPYVYFSKQEAQKLSQSSIRETLTWEEFQKESSGKGISGRLLLKVRRPRFDRIDQLKKASPNEICKLIASWR